MKLLLEAAAGTEIELLGDREDRTAEQREWTKGFTASIIQDHVQALRRSPELVRALALASDLADESRSLIQAWGHRIAQRVEGEFRKFLGESVPAEVITAPPLSETFEFPADEVQIAVVEAICSSRHWTAAAGFLKAHQTVAGKRGVTVRLGITVERDLEAWSIISAAIETAVKLHFLLWGHFLQQQVDHRTGWAWLDVQRICADLSYKKHHKGGFREYQRKQVVELALAFSRLHLAATLPSNHGQPAADWGGPLRRVVLSPATYLGAAPYGDTAVWFRPGSWFSESKPYRRAAYLGQLSAAYFQLRSDTDATAIRLGGCIAARARTIRGATVPHTVRIQTLLNRSCLRDFYATSTRDLKASLEGAVEKLSKLGILAAGGYSDEEPALAEFKAAVQRFVLQEPAEIAPNAHSSGSPRHPRSP